MARKGKVAYPNLVRAMVRRGVTRWDLARCIWDESKSAVNQRMVGTGAFTWSETNAIANKLFPGLDRKELFRRAEDKEFRVYDPLAVWGDDAPGEVTGVYYPNLRAEMAARGLRTVDVAKMVGMEPKDFNHKLNGKYPFTEGESSTILYEVFPELILDYLFYPGNGLERPTWGKKFR